MHTSQILVLIVGALFAGYALPRSNKLLLSLVLAATGITYLTAWWVPFEGGAILHLAPVFALFLVPLTLWGFMKVQPAVAFGLAFVSLVLVDVSVAYLTHGAVALWGIGGLGFTDALFLTPLGAAATAYCGGRWGMVRAS